MAKKSLKKRIDEALDESGNTFGEAVLPQIQKIESKYGAPLVWDGPDGEEAPLSEFESLLKLTPERVREDLKSYSDRRRGEGWEQAGDEALVPDETNCALALAFDGGSVDPNQDPYSRVEAETESDMDAMARAITRVVRSWLGIPGKELKKFWEEELD